MKTWDGFDIAAMTEQSLVLRLDVNCMCDCFILFPCRPIHLPSPHFLSSVKRHTHHASCPDTTRSLSPHTKYGTVRVKSVTSLEVYLHLRSPISKFSPAVSSCKDIHHTKEPCISEFVYTFLYDYEAIILYQKKGVKGVKTLCGHTS